MIVAKVTYRNYGDDNETTYEFTTIEDARGFYDSLNDDILMFAILSDQDGNVFEEKPE